MDHVKNTVIKRANFTITQENCQEVMRKTNVSQLSHENREQSCHKIFLIFYVYFSLFVSYHLNYFHVVLDIFQQFLSLY